MPFDFRGKAARRRYFSPRAYRVVLTRERYYSLFAILAVKIILFAYLWTLFGWSIRIMRKSFKNISDAWRVALPAAIVIIAAVIAWNIYKNIKEIIALRREMQEQRPH